jgi:hypothetical protein
MIGFKLILRIKKRVLQSQTDSHGPLTRVCPVSLKKTNFNKTAFKKTYSSTGSDQITDQQSRLFQVFEGVSTHYEMSFQLLMVRE